MRSYTPLSTLVPLALLAACAPPAMPPKELVDARTEYAAAANGPAASESPAQLHAARTALDNAERRFQEDGDALPTRDRAYIALRKAQIAQTIAQTQLALTAKAEADAQAARQQSESLRRAQETIQSSQQSLAKTQQQLEQERAAHAEAERRAAQAMADLRRIASVRQESRGMVITLSGSVLFRTAEATLLPGAVVRLNDVADALIKGNPDANITIEGHTDSQGSTEYNQDLSQRRAESVKAQLVARGVAADRIKTVGVGEDRPIASNTSPEGRANNRRVEIIVGEERPPSTPVQP